MHKKIFIIILLNILILSYSYTVSSADSAASIVQEGNKLYSNGKYDQALKNYNNAQVSLPDSDIINFNMGAAYYKKGDYQKAVDAFTRALTTDNQKLEADASYNIGNSTYKQGKLKENTDLSKAIDYYKQSLDYYKRAVELDESNKKARYNHELVEKQLKMLLDRQKNQPSPSKSKKEEKKQKENQQSSSPQPGEKREKEEKQIEKEQKATPESNQEEKLTEEDNKKERKKNSGTNETDKDLSKEEAQMLLNSHDQEEIPFGETRTKRKNGYTPEVLRDW